MTIKQLYEWATENDAQNFDIGFVSKDDSDNCIYWFDTESLYINKDKMEVAVL